MSSHDIEEPRVRSSQYGLCDTWYLNCKVPHKLIDQLKSKYRRERQGMTKEYSTGIIKEDYVHAVEEVIAKCKDPVTKAEIQIAWLANQTFNWFDVLKWNELVIKFLSNDYFPLLRSDDMPENGDRICPMHALDLLLQKEGIALRDRILTEEEFDRLQHYRKMVKDITEYAILDLGQRRGILAKRLNFTSNARDYVLDLADELDSRAESDSVYRIVERYDSIPLHDVNYVWEGKPYQPEVFQKIRSCKTKTRDCLPSRMPKNGDKMKLVKTPKNGAYHQKISRVLEAGDEIVVSRCSLHEKTVLAWYWREVSYTESHIPLECLESDKFNVKIPEWFGERKPFELPRKSDDSYRPKFLGLNAYSDALIHDHDFLYVFRVTPKHLADIIALRFLDIITSQQAKVLLERCWDNFGWFDVIHHIHEMKMLEKADNDLREIIETVLKEQEQAVQDYKGGKKAAFGRLMGVSIKSCGGNVNPNEVRALLEEMLRSKSLN